MRICLDISPAVHRRAGLGRYAQELTESLLHLDKENEYVAFYNGPRGVVPQPPLDRLPRLTVGLSNKPWRMSILLAHHLGLNLDRLFPGVDLLHSTDHLLPPLRRVRTVFTVHDLIFLFFPEYHLPLNRWYLTLMMPRFIRRADAVITVSECSRRDLVRLYCLDQARIHVIYEGIDDRFRPVEDPEVLATVRRRTSRTPVRRQPHRPRRGRGTTRTRPPTPRARARSPCGAGSWACSSCWGWCSPCCPAAPRAGSAERHPRLAVQPQPVSCRQWQEGVTW